MVNVPLILFLAVTLVVSVYNLAWVLRQVREGKSPGSSRGWWG